MSGISDLEPQFLKAVKLLSEVDPIYAYKLASAGKTKYHLSRIDEYNSSIMSIYEELNKLENRKVFAPLTGYISDKLQLDSANEIESYIKTLSRGLPSSLVVERPIHLNTVRQEP